MPLTQVTAAPHRPDPRSWPDTQLTVAWLGHASVLLNFHGSRVLTDPALEQRIGIGRGLAKLGPRRLVQPALGSLWTPGIVWAAIALGGVGGVVNLGLRRSATQHAAA